MMMSRSTIKFDYQQEKNLYDVYAQLPQPDSNLEDPSELIRDNRRSAGTVIDFEKMKSNKIQLAISMGSQSEEVMDVEGDRDSAANNLKQTAYQYIKTIDAVETIKKNLESLMGFGAIFDLKGHIIRTMEEITTSEADEDSEDDSRLQSSLMNPIHDTDQDGIQFEACQFQTPKRLLP